MRQSSDRNGITIKDRDTDSDNDRDRDRDRKRGETISGSEMGQIQGDKYMYL